MNPAGGETQHGFLRACSQLCWGFVCSAAALDLKRLCPRQRVSVCTRNRSFLCTCSLRKEELSAISGPNEFAEFYNRLKQIKEFHRKHPNEVRRYLLQQSWWFVVWGSHPYSKQPGLLSGSIALADRCEAHEKMLRAGWCQAACRLLREWCAWETVECAACAVLAQGCSAGYSQAFFCAKVKVTKRFGNLFCPVLLFAACCDFVAIVLDFS